MVRDEKTEPLTRAQKEKLEAQLAELEGPRRADVVEAKGMAGLMDDAMRWLIGPRLQRRFGVFVNVLARVLVQTKPAAFAAQEIGRAHV